jgi:dTDP-4-amino-4,6-dideoxygalactose transaminase
MVRPAPKNDLPLMNEEEGIVLFRPYVPQEAYDLVKETLDSRWIGQGPKVDLFESRFKSLFNLSGTSISTGSGTDALHLAYLLNDIGPQDEVIVPLFTCTATNIPLLYLGCKIVFADINPQTLNINVDDLRSKVTEKTKVIVVVHFGGLPCDMAEIGEIARSCGAVVIEDGAHALGSMYAGRYVGDISEFTMFSFQAIKQLTTGDGGMLVVKDTSLEAKAKRLRWFGIDRTQKQMGIWENDISEVGFKYQMTDISASIGLAGLKRYPETLGYRKFLGSRYNDKLKDIKGLQIVNDDNPLKVHSYWLYSVLVEDRVNCQKMLRFKGIESGQTHYRNDRYSIFAQNPNVKLGEFPYMDQIDDNYLILPLHMNVSIENIDYISECLKCGW